MTLGVAFLVLAGCGGESASSSQDADNGPPATADESTPAVSRGQDIASLTSPRCRTVTYTPPGREPRQGDLCIPETNPTRTAIVIAHGAGAVASRETTRISVAVWARYYVDHGVLAFNIDFTPATPPGPTYPEPIVDEKTAVQYLRLHARELGIDPNRIIVQGHSGGARMGGNVLVTPDDPYFSALGEWPRVSDAANGFIGFYGGYRGQIGADASYQVYYGGPFDSSDPPVRERLDHANSLAQAAKASGPALLFHGDADDIPVAASQVFANALAAAGVEAELVVVAGGGHGFDIARAPVRLSEQGLEAAAKILAWIQEHFK
jgi:acetyl esterase/lipase